MSIELPGWLTEPLSLVGMTWPEADEDLLDAAGGKWSQLATDLRGISSSALAAVQPVTAETTGDAAQAFETWWNGADGPKQRLGDDSDAAELLGTTLTGFAGITVALKLAYIAQLAILAAEIAQAIATAFFSFGATMAEVPGFVAATRVICRQALKKLLTHLQTVIKDILEKAKGLFKKLAKREATTVREIAARGARYRPTSVARLQKWERDAYDAIRRDGGDVDAITKNLPEGTFSREEIAQIKQHVFHDEHVLDKYGESTVGRFEPDADMAEAWMRLRNGTALPEDQVLLRHELAESNYLREHPGAGYGEAHGHANGVANWEQGIPSSTREDLDGYGR